uniref:TIR domain-containing protein n=1 Tax=Neogobius melanostomus TaxID=47308 RepID=A0A8C6U0Q4_9GOBI
MVFHTISLFSFLFLLLLPRPLLFYSLKNCTTDAHDNSIVFCDNRELEIIPPDIPRTATYLDLSENQLTKISQNDLTGFIRLQTLSVRINVISQIEVGAFSDLLALNELNLARNKLRNLSDNMFDGLSHLSILDLSRNKIKSISKFAFYNLDNLQELNLWNNNLVDMSNIINILQNCPLLMILDLGENNLTALVSDDFPFPSLNLTTLLIGENGLRKVSVQSNIFNKLESLVLSANDPDLVWEVSDKALFNSLKSLHLEMNGFEFETYQLIFQSVSSVETLYLRGTDSDLFNYGLLDWACHIPSLHRLDLSMMGINSISDSLFQACANIVDLNLSGNRIKDVSKSSVSIMTKLTRLYIEMNAFFNVPQAIKYISTLKILSLKANIINELKCSDFSNLTLLTELDLGDNDISVLPPCVFTDLLSLKDLNIENNQILQLQGLSLPYLIVLRAQGNNVGRLEAHTFKGLPSLTDLYLQVKKIFVDRDAFHGLKKLKNLTLSAPFFLDTFNELEVLERLDLHMYLENTDRPQMTNFTGFVPSLQELFLRADAEVSGTIPQLLLDLDKLKIFSSNKGLCHTYTHDALMFSHTPHLQVLQIINCAEFYPPPNLFQPMTELIIMDLTNNNLKSLDFLIEANLTKLEQLILRDNKLKIINETVFEKLPSLKYLNLTGNPFVCNCSNAGFIEWAIRNKQVQVANAYQYRCSSPSSEEGNFLLDFNVRWCWEFTGFLCFISSSALVLLTLLSSFIFHFLCWHLVYGYYLLQAFLYDSKKRRQGCPHIYDAFVSYNVHDEDWVYGELLHELEERQGWKLCLHHRDFIPGKSIIENITDAIYSSRKTLCVISRRYLQSEWCSREIQLASFRLFDEHKDVLILLFLEEISSNQLSPFYRMRKLVKSRTYLSWTQARRHKGLFWEKVRRALECGYEPGDNHNPLIANA